MAKKKAEEAEEPKEVVEAPKSRSNSTVKLAVPDGAKAVMVVVEGKPDRYYSDQQDGGVWKVLVNNYVEANKGAKVVVKR